MIKLFYDNDNNVYLTYYAELPDELKNETYMKVKELPEPEENGKLPVLKCDGTKVWYDYVERPLTETEQLQAELELTNQTLAEIMMLLPNMVEEV